MSFFDETKNFGLILLIVSLVGLILDVVFMFVEVGGTKTPIIAGIGSIVGELIVAIYAYGVYTGQYLIPIDRFLDDAATKFGVIKGFVSVYAISSILDAVFTLIGGIVNGNLGGALVSIIISILIALLCIFAVLKMSDGTIDTADKVIYYILMVLFILMIILGILTLIAIVGIIPLVEGIMLLVMLTSPEVKQKFGV